MLSLSVLVPCFDEEDSIGILIERLDPTVDILEESYEVEVICVDDGSTDATTEIVKEYAKTRPWLKLVSLPSNRGLGRAVEAGLEACSGDRIAMLDADATFPPEDIERLLHKLEEGWDIVIGSAFHPEGSAAEVAFLRLFVSRSLSKIYQTLTQTRIHSFSGIFRVYRRDVFDHLQIDLSGFAGVSEILLKCLAMGMYVIEVPSTLTRRQQGESKLRVLPEVRNHLRLMSRFCGIKLAQWRGKRRDWGRLGIIPLTSPDLLTDGTLPSPLRIESATRAKQARDSLESKSPMPRTVAVIGGGMMGLSVANEFAKQGDAVEVFEAASLGGLAGSLDFGPFRWDRFYHCILSTDTDLLGLLDEIGLADDVHWQKTASGFHYQGERYSLDTIAKFLRFQPLRFHQRIRLGLFLVLCGRVFSGDSLEGRTAEAFLRRYCGDGIWEVVWRPLLRAKLGMAASRVSARFIWDTVTRLNSARSGVQQREMLGYVSGGYARILEVFAAHLEARGVTFKLGTAVRGVESLPDGSVSVTTEETSRIYDRVVITLANPIAERLLPKSPELTRKLASVDYLGVCVAGVVLRRSVSPYYILNISDPNIDVTGLIGMSNLVRDGHFDGLHLYYLPKYLTQEDPAWQRTEGDWKNYFHSQLRLLVPDLRLDDVVDMKVSRARHVQPLLDIDYRDRMPPVDLGLSGVSLVNSSQCYQGPIHIDMIVRHARQIVESLAR